MNKKGLFLVLAILITSSLIFLGCVKIITSIGDDDGEPGLKFTVNYTGAVPVDPTYRLSVKIFGDSGLNNMIYSQSSESSTLTINYDGVRDYNTVYIVIWVDVCSQDGNYQTSEPYMFHDGKSASDTPIPTTIYDSDLTDLGTIELTDVYSIGC